MVDPPVKLRVWLARWNILRKALAACQQPARARRADHTLRWNTGALHRTIQSTQGDAHATPSHFRLTLAAAFALIASALAQPSARTYAGPDFGGVWSSQGCEAYPGGPFVKREIVIDGGRFSQVITAYTDGACIMPTLRMRVEGTFVFKGISPIVPTPGVYDVELRWEQVFLRPERTNEAEFLNTHRPGLCAGNWSVGAEQDLAVTKGCRKLGINLSKPVVE